MSEYPSASRRPDPVEQTGSDATRTAADAAEAATPAPPRRTLDRPLHRPPDRADQCRCRRDRTGAVPRNSSARHRHRHDHRPGASFYRISAETQGLELGQRAPDFVGKNGDREGRLTDLDGREIRLADFLGKPVWVVFWATWCPPCQQETPDIRDVFEASRDKGLVVVAIDVQEPVDAIRGYAERYGLTYTIGVDKDAAIMRTYAVVGLPSHYFIDRRGVIVDRYFGGLKRDQMEQRIELISRP